MIALQTDSADDPSFVQRNSAFVARLLERIHPNRLWVIKIDNWFDHKWLKFYGTCYTKNTDRQGLPPFPQGRIISSVCYSSAGEKLHSKKVRFELPKEGERTTFFWYSGRTSFNRRASAMCYTFDGDEELESWYISFVANPEWRINRIKGISAGVIEPLLEPKGEIEC